jgi:hypothetical protein
LLRRIPIVGVLISTTTVEFGGDEGILKGDIYLTMELVGLG